MMKLIGMKGEGGWAVDVLGSPHSQVSKIAVGKCPANRNVLRRWVQLVDVTRGGLTFLPRTCVDIIYGHAQP